MHVRKPLMKFVSEAASDFAELLEAFVVALRRIGGGKAGFDEELCVHSARRSNDHTRIGLLEIRKNAAHGVAVAFADGLLKRTVGAVIHPVAQRGDGGLEHGEIVLHSPEKSAGGLAAPPELAHADILPAFDGKQVGFDVFGIELLFGDGVSDHGDARVGRETVGFRGAPRQGKHEAGSGQKEGREGGMVEHCPVLEQVFAFAQPK